MIWAFLLLEGTKELVEVLEGRFDALLLWRSKGKPAVLQEAAQVHFEEGTRILCNGTRSATHPLHLEASLTDLVLL